MQSVNAVSSLFWKPRTSPARLKHRARGNAAASKKARQTGSKGKRKKKTRRQANGVRDKCRTPRARKKVKAEAVTQAQNKKAYTELMPNGFGNPSSAIVEDASVFAVTLLRVSEVLVGLSIVAKIVKARTLPKSNHIPREKSKHYTKTLL